jgi:hypothetical protein
MSWQRSDEGGRHPGRQTDLDTAGFRLLKDILHYATIPPAIGTPAVPRVLTARPLCSLSHESYRRG